MIDESSIMEEAERLKTWWRLAVLVLVVVGIAALVGLPIIGGVRGVVAGVAIAAIVWAGAGVVHFSWLAAPRPEGRTKRVEVGGGAEFHVGLRPQLPLMILFVGAGLATFFGLIAVVLGSALWLIAGGAFALLGVVIVPDAIRALTASGREAVIDATGFTYRGYSYETRLAWDDIALADLDTSNKNRPTFAFLLRPGARLSWKKTRWIARLEPDPAPDRFYIPVIVFDEPMEPDRPVRGDGADPGRAPGRIPQLRLGADPDGLADVTALTTTSVMVDVGGTADEHQSRDGWISLAEAARIARCLPKTIEVARPGSTSRKAACRGRARPHLGQSLLAGARRPV